MRVPHKNAGPDSSYWFSRLFIAGSALIVTLVPLLDADSYDRLMLVSTGPVGIWGSWALVLLCAALLLDVVGNDVMRERLPRLQRARTMLLSIVAIGQCCLLFVFVKDSSYVDRGVYHLLLAWQVVATIAIAWLDLFARHSPR